MQIVKEIDKCKYLNLLKLEHTNVLKIIVEESKLSEELVKVNINNNTINNMRKITSNNKCKKFKIEFENFIAYSNRNESYTTWDDYEEFKGNLFRIYKKSRFIDYIKLSTFAIDDNDTNEIIHYGIICGDFIIDVISTAKPKIEQEEIDSK